MVGTKLKSKIIFLKQTFWVFLSLAAFCTNTFAAPGDISTIAGNGFTYLGDGGAAVSASLNHPTAVAVDASGNIYIADFYNHRIRKVDASGVITTVAGNGTAGYSGDGGPAVDASLDHPTYVAVDASENIYITDYYNNRIRKVDASGVITTFAGNGIAGYSGDGGPAASASLNNPGGVAVDASGNIYIADYFNNRIRKVDASTGNIRTVAGNGTLGYSGDGGPAASANLFHPTSVAVDASGNIYIADLFSNRIRKVNASTGYITTIAGNGTAGYSGDGGPAVSANLDNPNDVAVDALGNIYIADENNERIRKVNASTGVITTIAGNGTYGYSGDGGPATSASLAYPKGVAVDASGNIYIADANNDRIRKVEGGNTDVTAPTTVASPSGGTYNSPRNVTLSCDDGAGSGCANIYYTIDGATPTTNSSVYSSAIAISGTTTLKFFAKDNAGNSESVNTETYVRTYTYTVTTTATNGAITSGNNPEVAPGSATTVTGSANADCYFASVSGCGGTVQSNSDQSVTTFSYETGAITGNCTVVATFALAATNADNAPTISGTPATTVYEDAPYIFTPTASDADAGDVLTFSIVNKPSWASFDPATGALTGTPANSDVGTTTGIVISVADQAGAEAALPAFDLEVISANQDSDGDGFTDVEELAAGSDPADSSDTPLDHKPLQPTLSNLEADQTLPFSKFNFTLSPMDDPDTTGQKPAAVEWSIEESFFGLELYKHESAPQELPSSILLPVALFSPDDGAAFSVRYKDAAGLWSDWSEAAEIKLAAEDGDLNGNGIEDVTMQPMLMEIKSMTTKRE